MRKGELKDVLAGIEAADRAGFKIKLNVVALKGINDVEWIDIVNWATARGYDVTFIESMPMGDIGQLRNDHFMPLDLVQQTLESALKLSSSNHKTGGPARYMKVAGSDSRVGFISPYTHNFCESCNRVRVSCTGQLYLCLGQDDMVDLRQVLRTTEDPQGLKQAILDGIAIKPKGHDFDAERLADGAQVVRFMSHTGG